MTTHTFYLTDLQFEIFGECDLVEFHRFYHPCYFAARDKVIGMFYKDFQDAVMEFEIHNN
jgi:hypothetical protein